jgi:DNA-binding NtrC family response regulator
MEILQKYSWPGNVRELKNLMEKLVVLTKGEKIGIDSIPSLLVPSCDSAQEVKKPEHGPVPDQHRTAAVPGGLSLRAMEEEFILRALKLAEGNQRKAARFLSISRDTLRYRLRKLRIDSSKFSQ